MEFWISVPVLLTFVSNYEILVQHIIVLTLVLSLSLLSMHSKFCSVNERGAFSYSSKSLCLDMTQQQSPWHTVTQQRITRYFLGVRLKGSLVLKKIMKHLSAANHRKYYAKRRNNLHICVATKSVIIIYVFDWGSSELQVRTWIWSRRRSIIHSFMQRKIYSSKSSCLDMTQQQSPQVELILLDGATIRCDHLTSCSSNLEQCDR
jgi:hypothetical protein